MAGLKAVVVVESRREINGKITDETRFYITSLVMLATAAPDDPRPLGHREFLAPGTWTWSFVTTNAASEPTTPGQFRNLPEHRLQSYPKGPGQGFHPPQAQTAGWDDEYLASLIAA